MHLPGPLRAAVGLVVSAADEARKLPDRALELPMAAVSTALQASMRAQQRYARLAARGDEVLTRREAGDEPPPWATFDEPVSDDDLRRSSALLDGLFGVDDPDVPGDAPDPDPDVATGTVTPIAKAAGRARKAGAPATKAAKKAARPTKKVASSTARKAGAQSAGGGSSVPAKKAVKATPPRADRRPKDVAKNVTAPRNAAPSRFDAVGLTADDESSD